MPRPGARQPLFQPPVAGGGRRGAPEGGDGEAPRAGERGWLVSLAEKMREEQGADTGVSSSEGSQSQGGPSSGASRASGEGSAGLVGPSGDSGVARSSQAASQSSVASSMELLASQAVSSQVLAMTVGPSTQVTPGTSLATAPRASL